MRSEGLKHMNNMLKSNLKFRLNVDQSQIASNNELNARMESEHDTTTEPSNKMRDVQQIVCVHNRARYFNRRAYSVRNIPMLRKEYRIHIKKAKKIKKILRQLARNI